MLDHPKNSGAPTFFSTPLGPEQMLDRAKKSKFFKLPDSPEECLIEPEIQGATRWWNKIRSHVLDYVFRREHKGELR